ncbi:ParB N-terminal domain-containing protein [Lutibacter maritimus]|uniref:ParB-like nuclease domain-containing protein n=1 Tax=Lutibacter maritimus TaxID=593133 RepID=A0A1I6NRP6_9FLAO|nr:ParB N-terminal domain-containing protein [Lutibacter maritimus]SFS30672.1 hypothetical protein SAMN04488006_0469 [Lutibacter maritimus]
MSKIEHIKLPISKIILLEENPREITDDELKKLSDDISKDPNFLHQRPSLINFTNGAYYCYAGTQRIKAQQLLGFNSAICFVENDVPYDIQKERMLKDNLHRGKWNEDKLSELDFSIAELEDIGFDFKELNIDTSLFDEPTMDELTAPKKDNPPTIKITFVSEKQMNDFEKEIIELKRINPLFQDIKYSFSLGEL